MGGQNNPWAPPQNTLYYVLSLDPTIIKSCYSIWPYEDSKFSTHLIFSCNPHI